MVALRATCPLVEEDTWSRPWNSATLLFAPQLLLFVFGGWAWDGAGWWVVALALGGAASSALALQRLPADNGLPPEKERSVFILLAFTMS
jgi:hypothetical protein